MKRIYIYSLSLEIGINKVPDIVLAVQINVDKVSLTEVVHALFHEIVLSKAFLKVDSLLISEVQIDHGINLELLFAESNSLPHSGGQGPLLMDLGHCGLLSLHCF